MNLLPLSLIAFSAVNKSLIIENVVLGLHPGLFISESVIFGAQSHFMEAESRTYFIFAGHSYYPKGGAYDLQFKFRTNDIESLEETFPAVNKLINENEFGWAHIMNDFGQIVCKYDNALGWIKEFPVETGNVG